MKKNNDKHVISSPNKLVECDLKILEWIFSDKLGFIRISFEFMLSLPLTESIHVLFLVINY